MKPLIAKLSTSPQSSFKYKWTRLDSFEFNWHCHPEYELMLILKSRGKRFVGDNISYYKEGDLVFLGSNLPHTHYSPVDISAPKNKCEAILIHFAEDFAGMRFAETPELQHIFRLFKKASCGIRVIGKTRTKVAKKMIKMNTLNGVDRLVQLLTILSLLGQATAEDQKILSSIEFVYNLQPNQQSRIDRVCTYINQHYKDELRLENIAGIAAMSVTAFCRFFKKSTGKTFVGYVNELRIGYACRLLIESEMTIAEICFEVGFNNISNFNRRFFERYHASPREYRKEFDNSAK